MSGRAQPTPGRALLWAEDESEPGNPMHGQTRKGETSRLIIMGHAGACSGSAQSIARLVCGRTVGSVPLYLTRMAATLCPRLMKNCLLVLLLGIVPVLVAADPAPASVFDLKKWKLQIPGPKEVKQLSGYSSDAFKLTGKNEMCFHVDAAEKGTTPNAHYVRSELRHLQNWKATESHTLMGEFRVETHLEPDKITALQIHGIMPDGSDAPPLLRIAVNKGDLVAMIKTDAAGEETESVPLKKGLGSSWVKVEIAVKNKQLTITVDASIKLTRSLAFWKYPNYFKAGAYPQATKGTVDVFFRKLKVD